MVGSRRASRDSGTLPDTWDVGTQSRTRSLDVELHALKNLMVVFVFSVRRTEERNHGVRE
jgi:hypothetical protein